MGLGISKLNPFRKKTIEERLEAKKTLLVISCSANIADKNAPHCVREYEHLEKNHAFKTQEELVSYIFQKYGDGFEIKEYERIRPSLESQYKSLFDAYRQQMAKK